MMQREKMQKKEGKMKVDFMVNLDGIREREKDIVLPRSTVLESEGKLFKGMNL